MRFVVILLIVSLLVYAAPSHAGELTEQALIRSIYAAQGEEAPKKTQATVRKSRNTADYTKFKGRPETLSPAQARREANQGTSEPTQTTNARVESKPKEQSAEENTKTSSTEPSTQNSINRGGIGNIGGIGPVGPN